MNTKIFVFTTVLLITLAVTASTQGSIKCADLLAGNGEWSELKIDQKDAELTTYTADDGFTVALTEIIRSDENEIISVSWQTLQGVSAVIFKAGPVGYVEYYDPAALSDTNNYDDYGGINALSHLSFCYVVAPTAVSLNNFSAQPLSWWQMILELIGV